MVAGTVNTVGSSNIAYIRNGGAGRLQLWASSDYHAIARPVLTSPASGDAINSNWSDPFTLRTAAPAQNQVSATFETNCTYPTLGDSVGNITTRQPMGLSSTLRNQSDATGQAVVGPILNLSTTENVTSVYSAEYLVIGSTYRWQFPDIAQNQSFNGGGNIARMADFGTGFSVSRSVNQRRFPTTGGTQLLALSVTPKEPMERLELHGNTVVFGLVIAYVLMPIIWWIET